MSAREPSIEEMLSAADRLLSRPADIRKLSLINPAEARKLETIIEGFEKGFARFLAETEQMAKYREVAKEMILKFAAIRADLKSGGRESGN
jgi:hypothetical protein